MKLPNVRLIVVLAGCLLLGASSLSNGPVIDVVNVPALQTSGRDFSAYPALYLENYYVPGDGGGGLLVKTTLGSSICPSADNVVCFQDGNSNYFGRASVGGNSNLAMHGRVRFDYNLGNTQFQVCPSNGDGIIISNVVRTMGGCSVVSSSATTSSALNYFYLTSVTATITSIANDGGKAQLVFSGATSGLNNGMPVTCLITSGTPLATVLRDTNTSNITTAHFTLTDVTFVATGTGTCTFLRLIPATTGYVTTTGGVEVESGSTGNTLVGMASIGASHAVSDCSTPGGNCLVASYFSRQLKKMVVKLGAVAATTTSATYVTPTSNTLEGSFVTWGPQASPGTYPVTTVQWSITASANNTTAATTNGIGACFGTSILSANSACGSTVEPEDMVTSQGVNNSNQAFSMMGATTTVTEGLNYMDLVMKASANTFTLKQSQATINVYLMQ